MKTVTTTANTQPQLAPPNEDGGLISRNAFEELSFEFDKFSMSRPINVPLAEIPVATSPYRVADESEDHERAAELAERLANGGNLPAIVLRIVDGKPSVIDGVYRVAAYRIAGRVTIPAKIVSCTDSAAKAYFLREHARLGHRLKRNEIRAITYSVLRFNPDLLDLLDSKTVTLRAMGDCLGVSKDTVQRVHEEIRAEKSKPAEAVALRSTEADHSVSGDKIVASDELKLARKHLQITLRIAKAARIPTTEVPGYVARLLDQPLLKEGIPERSQ